MATDRKQRLTFQSPPGAAAAKPSQCPPCSPDPTALHMARQTADRLLEIEQELVRRIVEHHEPNRTLRHLLAELHICSSRMRKQIAECATECAHAVSRDQAQGERICRTRR